MKAKIGAAVGILLVSGVIGWQTYADQQLKKFYTAPQSLMQDKRLRIHNSEFEMGILSGNASADFRIFLDLCSDNALSFQVKNQIHRTWRGYEIESKIYWQPDGGSAPIELEEHTEISWNRQAHSHVILPAGNTGNVTQGGANWSDITLDFTWRLGETGIEVEHFDFHMPELTVSSPNDTLAIENTRYSGNLASSTTFFQPGENKASIERMTILGTTPATLNKIEMNIRQNIKNDKLDSGVEYRIGNIQVSDKALQNLRINLKLKDISRNLADKIVAISQASSQRCVPSSEYESMITQLLQTALADGLSLESTGNELSQGQAKATLDADLKLAPTTAANAQETIQQVLQRAMQTAQYHFNLTMDKAFLKADDVEMDEAALAQAITDIRQKLPPEAQLQDQGNKIVIQSSKP